LAISASDTDGSGEQAASWACSEQVESAWSESLMGPFPPHVTQALLEDAREVPVPAGEIFYRGAEHADAAVLALVVDGLVRISRAGESGRKLTIRYAWPGHIIGLPTLVLASAVEEFGPDRWQLYGGHRLYAEALRDTLILKMSPTRFLELAQSEESVAYAVAKSLAHFTVEAEQMLEDGLFLSIRARVARHLLDLAVSRDGVLVVDEGHREIADAIGSVRAVVSRTLVRLRDEGLVDRRETETVLLDTAALHVIATAG
jgi:CRP-like cAMP-binding protein